MSKSIEISLETYERLANLAQGFDSPANVIERLLDAHENLKQRTAKDTNKPSRDYSKYTFMGTSYGKGKLVLAVVKYYVSNASKPLSHSDLKIIFPDVLQGKSGVFTTLDEAKEIYSRTKHKRHAIGASDTIKLSDASIAVCNQWGVSNINKFLEKAKSLGYTIKTETSN